MELICINDNWNDYTGILWAILPATPPVFMEKYTSIGVFECKCGCGYKGHILREYPGEFRLSRYPISFPVDHFAEVSEIDETEMVRETLKELV